MLPWHVAMQMVLICGHTSGFKMFTLRLLFAYVLVTDLRFDDVFEAQTRSGKMLVVQHRRMFSIRSIEKTIRRKFWLCFGFVHAACTYPKYVVMSSRVVRSGAMFPVII